MKTNENNVIKTPSFSCLLVENGEMETVLDHPKRSDLKTETFESGVMET